MLSTSAVNIALSSVTPYVTDKPPFVTSPNTMMNELMNALMAGVEQYELPPEADRGAFLLRHVTEGSNDLFDSIQDTLEEQLVTAVSSHISFAKNVVKPLWQEFSQKVVESTSAYSPKDASADFNIIKARYPDPLTDEAFLKDIMLHKGSKAAGPAKFINFGEFNKEKALNALSTGYADMDNLIKKWIAGIPIEFFEQVWNDYFGSNHCAGSYIDAGKNTSQVYLPLGVFLTVYLWCKHLSADVVDTNVSLGDYKHNLALVEVFAATMIADKITAANFADKSGRLIHTVSNDRKSVMVSESVYTDFLSKGGSPEMVLGVLVTNASTYNSSAILADAEKLMKGWNSYVMFTASGENDRFIEALRHSYVNHFTQAMQTLRPEEEEYLTSKQMNKTDFVRRCIETAYEKVQTLTQDQLRNVPDVALSLVAGIRFSYSSAYDIINDINQVYIANPDLEIDIREAALVASYKYLARFFSAQITTA